MFFSKKGPSQPAAAKPTSSGGADRRRTYHTVVNYLRGKDYKFDENADEFHIFFPTGLDTGHYTLLWKIEERYVTLVAMSPFSITGCSVDDVTLLCALATANLVNGSFYPTTDGEHIMVEVTQRVYSDREFGEKTAAYLLGHGRQPGQPLHEVDGIHLQGLHHPGGRTGKTERGGLTNVSCIRRFRRAGPVRAGVQKRPGAGL